MTEQKTLYLSDLKKGQSAIMTGFDTSRCVTEHFATTLRDRLMEMGFEVDRKIEVLQKGLISGDPIAVKIGHMTIAMRKSEANAITVKLGSAPLDV